MGISAEENVNDQSRMQDSSYSDLSNENLRQNNDANNSPDKSSDQNLQSQNCSENDLKDSNTKRKYERFFHILGIIMKIISFGIYPLILNLQRIYYENNFSKIQNQFKEYGIDGHSVVMALRELKSFLEKALENFYFAVILAILYPYALNELSRITTKAGFTLDYVIAYLIVFYYLYKPIISYIMLDFIVLISLMIVTTFLYIKFIRSRKYAQFFITFVNAAYFCKNLALFFKGTEYFVEPSALLNVYSKIAQENDEITRLIAKYNVKPENVFITHHIPKYSPAISLTDYNQGKVAITSQYLICYTHKQLCAILSRELGHVKFEHSLFELKILMFKDVLQTTFSLLTLTLIEKYISTPQAIVFVLFQRELIDFLFLIFTNKFVSQNNEYEADSFSIKEGYGKEFISALIEMTGLFPFCYDYISPMNLFQSYPSFKDRIKRLQEDLNK